MSNPGKPDAKAIHPLPLSLTLHDLALLRASDIDFASLLPPPTPDQSTAGKDSEGSGDAAIQDRVQRSMEFSREARAALKLLHTDAAEREGARVDQIREKLEDAMKGLDGTGE